MFYDDEHRKRIEKFDKLWNSDALKELEEMAKEFDIADIWQDNGAKVLQQLIYMNLRQLHGREGNDAVGENGVEWELKSINIATSATGFSTNHHVNEAIIEKYRKVPWAFAVYKGAQLIEIYVVSASTMEEHYEKWEKGLQDRRDKKKKAHSNPEDNEGVTLNNPKIPLKWVREHGILVYPINSNNPVDPDDVI